MKKIFLLSFIALLTLNCIAAAPTRRVKLKQNEQKQLKMHQKDESYSIVEPGKEKDLKARYIVQRLKNLPYKEPYEIIAGKNSTGQPIEIEFKDLYEIDPAYRDRDVFGYKKNGVLYFYINKKFKSAPSTLLATIVAGRLSNLDNKTTSKNKVCYNMLLEGYVWHYYTHNANIRSKQSRLVDEEITIENLIQKDKEKGTQLINFVNENAYFKDLPQESDGFSDIEFSEKFYNLLKLYREIDKKQYE